MDIKPSECKQGIFLQKERGGETQALNDRSLIMISASELECSSSTRLLRQRYREPLSSFSQPSWEDRGFHHQIPSMSFKYKISSQTVVAPIVKFDFSCCCTKSFMLMCIHLFSSVFALSHVQRSSIPSQRHDSLKYCITPSSIHTYHAYHEPHPPALQIVTGCLLLILCEHDNDPLYSPSFPFFLVVYSKKSHHHQ